MRKKNALVIGIANRESISAGIAEELHRNGYRIVATYLNEKALRHVREVTDALGVEDDALLPFEVGNKEQLDGLVAYLRGRGMRLDVILHGIAYASEIRKELHEVSWKSFRDSTRISAFSLVEITRRMLDADLLNPGCSILTLSYIGSHLAVEGYNMMGPVKSILEALVRGLASELGGKGIRVNALSPGPVMTRAASGIGGFSDLINHVRSATPLDRTATLEDIGNIAYEVITNPSINGGSYVVDCGSSVLVRVGREPDVP
ncbi:enoyl-ACP reductase FabI [Desulfoluna spongiiphila]|uniref:Enoyl-[acyl-carrier-protein] reductase [NADH] n=1 Tax=Desulfoluna spongiiphila TaxID=419481 RepID=A0A1G5IS15_9BACT|nr:SDR family oxidoreductase [Desulfoluna spongiiphila]SCY78540.1 Enoyl-[acyl-carrier-protein] reductase [NADH] [Desulfoluna spongiiphila]VVS92535.1 enoyl-[acyl-carrier-protein] reductase (nadh) [Desulfoluna spongiiphila]